MDILLLAVYCAIVAVWACADCRKVGGIWFFKVGRVGFTFWVSKKAKRAAPRSAWMDPA